MRVQEENNPGVKGGFPSLGPAGQTPVCDQVSRSGWEVEFH